MKLGESKLLRLAFLLALLGTGFLVQFHFFRAYPQPILFGDPGAYHRVGMKMREAIGEWADGATIGEAYGSFRPYAYLIGTGSIYAGVDSVRGALRSLYDSVGGAGQPEWLRPLPFFRIVWALFNTLGMLGCFLFASRLSGSFAGGWIALAAAAVYPSFSTQSGRLYPDPVFSALFVWSAYCFVRAIQASSIRWMVSAGLLLSGGFFARPQFMNYFALLIGFALVVSALFWIREARTRRMALAFTLSVLPSIVLWEVIVRDTAGDFREIERFGFFTFRQQQQYPYGFWMFLDSDGWVGPYQLKEGPFYEALIRERDREPGLMGDRRRQIVFTARYISSRLGDSVLLVLDNVYRLFDRPANDYQWDYPFAVRHQAVLQKILIVLAIAGIAAFTIERRSFALVFFVPLVLCAVYGLSTPKPRYGQPAMLILIGLAGALLAALGARRTKIVAGLRHGRAAIGALLLAGVALLSLGLVLRDSFPELARILRASSILALLGLPFVLVRLAFAARTRDSVLLTFAWMSLALVTGAHLVRDVSWHETELTLGGRTTGIEQEIRLSSAALNRLRAASQSYILFDIHAPSGELAPARITVSDKSYSGANLFPAMPVMGESTTAGGRNPRRYRQWWALPMERDALPATGSTLKISLTYDGAQPISLFGDRFREGERIYEGPSFGDWPHLAAPKIEYDGDYRLPVRRPLESQGTNSFRVERDLERVEMKAVLRIRIVTLQSNEAHFSWRSPSLTKDPARGVGFFAYSEGSVDAELLIDAEPVLTFPLGSDSDFDVRSDGYRLCHRSEGRRSDHAYGAYVLVFPQRSHRPHSGSAELTVRYRSGMSLRPLTFSVDPGADASTLSDLAQHCGLGKDELRAGAVEVVSAARNSYPEDTGRWSVLEVY